MQVSPKRLSILILALILPASWVAQSDSNNDAAFAMPQGGRYVEECGSCHTAYAPGLLPARSWQKMMGELDRHFGEDASLDQSAQAEITASLKSLASDSAGASMLMRRINSAIPANDAPQRISQTGFFNYMHDEVPSHIWRRAKVGSKANCGACHSKANTGRYLESEVRIPK